MLTAVGTLPDLSFVATPAIEDPDHALARRACAGEVAAFEDLYRRHAGRVHGVIARLFGGRSGQTEELAQDAFVRAWQALPQWRPEAAINTWLFQIARNLAIDHLRRRKSVQFVSDDAAGIDLPQEGPGPEAQAQTAQQYRLLEAALQQITPEHREIMLLREVEGLSYDEIAQVLAINPGTVKSRIARARYALLAQMQRHE